MISDSKTFFHKGIKIAAQFFSSFFGTFCRTSRIFLVSVLLSASVERCFAKYVFVLARMFHYGMVRDTFYVYILVLVNVVQHWIEHEWYGCVFLILRNAKHYKKIPHTGDTNFVIVIFRTVSSTRFGISPYHGEKLVNKKCYST